MWALYDELIAGIDPAVLVEEVIVGIHWTAVKANGAVGLAMTTMGTSRETTIPGKIRGMQLQALAAFSKSWNFIEASIGMAAINAFYNQDDKAGSQHPRENAFDIYESSIRGKKVCIIGHFKKIEETLAPICKLSMLERSPQSGDFPDSACEFIIPEQDVLLITGATFINKTFLRLISLAQNAKIIVLGPSTPLAPILAKYGVHHLSGFIVEDTESVLESVKLGIIHDVFASGKKVNILV